MDYEIKTTYEATANEREFCNDPAFYVWGADAHQHVATITRNDREIRVFCDGEMRIHLWESKEARERGDAHDVIRYCDRLIHAGLDTDAKLQEADDAGRIEWVNNAWFDLYAYGDGITDGWLNCVDFDLASAVAGAEEIITDDKYWAEIS